MTERTWIVPAELQAIPKTRAEVRKYLADHGISDAYDVLTVICELVTNALLHGKPDIELTLTLGEGCIRGAVVDHGPQMPQPRQPDADDDGGRGLHIVHQYTRRWGVQPLSHGSQGEIQGKCVWFECGVGAAS